MSQDTALPHVLRTSPAELLRTVGGLSAGSFADGYAHVRLRLQRDTSNACQVPSAMVANHSHQKTITIAVAVKNAMGPH